MQKPPDRFTRKGTTDQSMSLDHIPQQDWELTEEQLNVLGNYLSSTELLLDCLDLAAIEDRQAVLDRLLIPPDM